MLPEHSSVVALCIAQTPAQAHIEDNKKEQNMSSTRKAISGGFIGRAFAVFGAAINASSAVENHRRPARRDLAILGIDPKAFDQI